MFERIDMKTIIAIDPGASGGIAIRYPDGKMFTEKMPDTQGDVLELLRDCMMNAYKETTDAVVILEQVGGFCGTGQPGSAAFKFGEGFGFIKGVVQALGLRLELVRPQVWQKPLGLGTATACASKTIWKNKLKALAQRLYPAEKVTLATADALLILEWYRKTNQ